MPLLESTSRAPSASFDRKRGNVLSAAARVFSDVGYDRASMRRIAAEAEVSLAGIYHYVSGKEELLQSIQIDTFHTLLRNLRGSVEGIADPRRRLAAAVRCHVRHFGAHMAELKICDRELESSRGDAFDEVRRHRLAYFEAFHGIVRAVAPPGESHARSCLATANLFGMLGWIYRWYDPQQTRVGLDELAARQTALFLDGYARRDIGDDCEVNG